MSISLDFNAHSWKAKIRWICDFFHCARNTPIHNMYVSWRLYKIISNSFDWISQTCHTSIDNAAACPSNLVNMFDFIWNGFRMIVTSRMANILNHSPYPLYLTWLLGDALDVIVSKSGALLCNTMRMSWNKTNNKNLHFSRMENVAVTC